MQSFQKVNIKEKAFLNVLIIFLKVYFKQRPGDFGFRWFSGTAAEKRSKQSNSTNIERKILFRLVSVYNELLQKNHKNDSITFIGKVNIEDNINCVLNSSILGIEFWSHS
jgi:hypothetical protein